MTEDVRFAMERRAALEVRLLELDRFIQTAEYLLAYAEQRSVGSGDRLHAARTEKVAHVH
jgi:hypothetical protein